MIDRLTFTVIPGLDPGIQGIARRALPRTPMIVAGFDPAILGPRIKSEGGRRK